MRLIITRHGETEENKTGKLQGHLPGKLSSLGIEQAEKVALRLKNEKIDYIYSSDLARAADTAKEIAKYHPAAPIEFTQELREKDLGEYTGRMISELNIGNVDITVTPLAFLQPKEGESQEQISQRAKNLFFNILKKHHNDTVLLVGHGGINAAIIAAIINKPSNEIERQLNTSVSILDINKNKNYKTLFFNNIDHLND